MQNARQFVSNSDPESQEIFESSADTPGVFAPVAPFAAALVGSRFGSRYSDALAIADRSAMMGIGLLQTIDPSVTDRHSHNSTAQNGRLLSTFFG